MNPNYAKLCNLLLLFDQFFGSIFGYVFSKSCFRLLFKMFKESQAKKFFIKKFQRKLKLLINEYANIINLS